MLWCLRVQDSRTPALAVMLAVAVNIASNLVAVAWLGLGLQGAAATTVATQVGQEILNPAQCSRNLVIAGYALMTPTPAH
jgi:Na+-driven multidrug efflux pump